ncbi:MAG: DUF4433 domain-containing protein [Proteobacteria bacterium]|nr:DUF4433 domain-containing protein [Pseudomonadota bacterium]
MDYDYIKELHYITHIDNIPSITTDGILSHKRASKQHHTSVAMEEVQDRRARKIIPGGRPLHEYVNLYFDARNPMLYRLALVDHANLCVLIIDREVIKITGVVLTDRNASSDYVRFSNFPDGLRLIDRDILFAQYWTHPEDPIWEMEHKSIKCAEVLVPDKIDPSYILGAYTSCDESYSSFQEKNDKISVKINTYLFFR